MIIKKFILESNVAHFEIAVLRIYFLLLLCFTKFIPVSYNMLQYEYMYAQWAGVRSILAELYPDNGGPSLCYVGISHSHMLFESLTKA